MKITGILRDWHLEYWQGSFIIWGEMFDDVKNRFKDGTRVHTSRILSIDFEKNIAKTQNSTYKLEYHSRRPK